VSDVVVPALDRAFFRLVLAERAVEATFTSSASALLDQRLVEYETVLTSCSSGAGR
jgi:hypothetical protein